MAYIPAFSTWATGVFNGYQHKDNGIPNSYKYTVMSLSTVMHMIKVLGSQPNPLPRTNNLLFSLFVGVPFLVGSVFCTGDMMGKSIRYLEDKNTKKE
jgi:hypothetical protein